MAAGTELASAYITLLPDMSGAGRRISAQLGSSEVVRASESAGRSIGSRIMGNVSTAIKGTTAVVGALGTAIAGIAVKGGIDRQLNIENAQAKLKGLGNSTETVTAIMQDALGAVKGTAFGLDAAATTAASAVAAGIKPGKELENYLRLTADAATIAGTSMGDMGSIINKVTTSGKAQMDNLNQLSDRGIPIMQWLAEEYGVTSEELSKMVSEGKVDAETFRKVLEENIGGAALSSGDTTTGAFANMRAALSRVGVTMTEWFFPLVKGVFNGITTILDGLNDRMGPWADKFASWFQEKAGPVVDGFADRVLGQVDRISAGFALLKTGDFTAEIREALGAEEDSRLVDVIFRVRDAYFAALGAVNAFNGGRLDVDVDTDALTGLERISYRVGSVVATVRDEVRGSVTAMVAAYQAGGSDVTSSGLAGVMERIGLAARYVRDAVGTLDFSSWSNFKDSLGPAGAEAGSAFSSIGDSLVALKPAFKEFFSQLPKLGGSIGTIALAGLNAIAGGLAFLADHVDVVIKLMPLIVAGYLAWRVASLGLTAQSNKLQMAQLAMAPVLLANNTLRLTSILLENRQTAARLRQTTATAAETAATGANNAAQSTGVIARTRAAAATIAQQVATTASTIATRAAAAGQWLLNAALTANPISLVIAGIAALVAGLVWFFTKTELGKQIVEAAWSGIKTAIGAVSDWFSTSVQPKLSAAFDIIAAGATWLLDNAIKPAWSGIQSAISVVWGVLKPIFDANVAVLKFLGDVFWNVSTFIIQASWLALQAAFRAGWAFIRDYIFAPFKLGFDAVGNGFMWVWNNLISPAWELLKSGLSAGWTWINQNVFAPLSGGVGAVGGAFTAARGLADTAWEGIRSGAKSAWDWMSDHVFSPLGTAIGAIGDAFNSAQEVVKTAWGAISDAAVKPVNFVIETVYMNGIKNLFDTVAEKLGLPQRLPSLSPIGRAPASTGHINAGMYADGGILPGYTPGRDVHEFYSPTGGRLSLSGGEPIMRPEFGAAVGHGWVNKMNALARSGGVNAVRSAMGNGQAFASGGIWGWVKDKAGAAWDFAGNAANAVSTFMKDPVAGATQIFMKPVEALLGAISGGSFGEIIAGVPKTLVKAIVDGATSIFGPAHTDDGSDPASTGTTSPGSAGMGWQAMSAALRALVPGARITSGNRPGAKVAGTNIPSMHGLGRAIDIAPSMATFNALLSAFPNATELLFSPAGGRQRQRGRGGSFAGDTSGVTKQMHYNHIHWAMKNGGVWPGAKVYDDGGWLPPGGVAVNMSQRPEPIFSAEQWESIDKGQGNAFPTELVVVDVHGDLIGRMKVEAAQVLDDDKRSLSGHRGYRA